MKKKTLVASIVLISLFFGVTIVNFTLTPDLYTRIIPSDVDIQVHGYSLSSEFFISFEIEIWNPNPFFVIFRTADYDLFDPGVEIHFDNDSLTYDTFHIELPAVKTHFIKPGLTKRPYQIGVGFSERNASELPYGNYSFWGEINTSFKIMKFIKLIMVVNSTGIFYGSEKLPFDWGRMRIFTSNWGFITLILIQIPIFWVGNRRKNKNKGNKNL
jgi:hypothetical protein